MLQSPIHITKPYINPHKAIHSQINYLFLFYVLLSLGIYNQTKKRDSIGRYKVFHRVTRGGTTDVT